MIDVISVDADSFNGADTDFAVSVDDMGEGQIVLSQWNETEGRTDQVAVSWERLDAIVNALRPRYGDKNTDRAAVLDI